METLTPSEFHQLLDAAPNPMIVVDRCGRVTRVEILLRLPDRQGRVLAAGDFLPQAERYSLMPAIDR